MLWRLSESSIHSLSCAWHEWRVDVCVCVCPIPFIAVRFPLGHRTQRRSYIPLSQKPWLSQALHLQHRHYYMGKNLFIPASYINVVSLNIHLYRIVRVHFKDLRYLAIFIPVWTKLCVLFSACTGVQGCNFYRSCSCLFVFFFVRFQGPLAIFFSRRTLYLPSVFHGLICACFPVCGRGHSPDTHGLPPCVDTVIYRDRLRRALMSHLWACVVFHCCQCI